MLKSGLTPEGDSGIFTKEELREMARNKKNSPLETIETPVPQVGESTAKAFSLNPEAENLKSTKPRFSVTLKEDGTLDLSSMREDTRNRLREILRDPRTQELLGGVNMPELVSDQDIRMLYDLVGMIEAYAFSIAGKIDYDIAQKHAKWTEQQKDMLLQPSKNVILKNADKMAFAIRWKDEVILCMLLLTITRAKYEGARKEQEIRKEAQKQENPATQEAVM
jgi:hypothetical protein